MTDATNWRNIAGWQRHLLVIAAIIVATFIAGFFAYAGPYGFNVLLRRGGSYWITVAPSDPRLSDAMRVALRESQLPVRAGKILWRQIGANFDIAELQVFAAGKAVDRILLARIDPKHFRLVVRTAPAGNRELRDWVRELGAAAIINGSYYSRYGHPSTPLLSDGVLKGPRHYNATHGVFVASDDTARVLDLHQTRWAEAFKGVNDGLVSYPLLLGPEGTGRVNANPRWLANRSFVGQDSSGRIVLGTTEDAFFSLETLSEFLRTAPLDLTIALNLDGGPLACQAISYQQYKRDFCGEFELATDGDDLKLLRPVFGKRRWALPIVIAVLAK